MVPTPPLPTPQTPTWVIIPIRDNLAQTLDTVYDASHQSVPTRLLLVNQGSSQETRQELERLAEEHAEQIFCWSFDPQLPSLAAAWNRALDFVWSVGGEVALVANNDLRLHRHTIEVLQNVLHGADALFVSAVGVTKEQFDPNFDHLSVSAAQRGGPDFSCFLISRACHWCYRFDEGFIPCFTEDVDYHRRMMLDGSGHQIFSINLPFAHLSSQTLKQMDPEARQKVERQIQEVSRAHYVRCWGGPVNRERFMVKFDPASARDDVTTPELQARAAAGQPICGGDSPLAPATSSSD